MCGYVSPPCSEPEFTDDALSSDTPESSTKSLVGVTVPGLDDLLDAIIGCALIVILSPITFEPLLFMCLILGGHEICIPAKKWGTN